MKKIFLKSRYIFIFHGEKIIKSFNILYIIYFACINFFMIFLLLLLLSLALNLKVMK